MIFLLLFLVVVVIVLLILLLNKRRKYQQELGEISTAISLLIAHQSLSQDQRLQDSMLSKIWDQLFHLQQMNQRTQEKVSHQRDQTQKLITDIAHQLRTPLQNLQTYLEFLEKEEDQEKKEKYLRAIKQSQQKIVFLVDSFVKVSRFENRLIQLKKESIDLKSTLLKALTMVYEKASQKEIHITLDLPDNINYSHDGNWLCEALVNVLDNSIKYSSKQTNIVIAVRQNVLLTQIEIRDFGVGIELEEENLVFQRFYRGNRITTEEGYGIGLYLTREIIQQHGGTLRVKREEPGLTLLINLDNG